MTTQAALLWELQTLDLNLVKRRRRLKEIAALLGDHQQITEKRESLNAAETALRPVQTRSRDLDLEIKGLVQKAKTASDLLYSGKVRNPKELEDLQEEIAGLQKRQKQLEDSLIEVYLDIEERQTGIKSLQADLEALLQTEGTEHQKLHREAQKLQEELQDLEQTRQTAVQKIDPTALKKYDSMWVAKKGTPVSRLEGESCKLCGVEQTTIIVQKVHRGQELIFCHVCGRILS